MKTYALIYNNEVVDLVTTSNDITCMKHADIQHVDITSLNERPLVGYVYKDGEFSKKLSSVFSNSKQNTENLRLLAYSDPITGSDRYFAEAQALQAEGFSATSAEVKDIKNKGLTRKSEIKALYPHETD